MLCNISVQTDNINNSDYEKLAVVIRHTDVAKYEL